MQNTLQRDFVNPFQAWRPSGTGIVFQNKMGDPEERWLTLTDKSRDERGVPLEQWRRGEVGVRTPGVM